MRAPGSGRHDRTYRSRASRRGASASRCSTILGAAVLASLSWLSVAPCGADQAQTSLGNEQMLQANMAACGDRQTAPAQRIPRCTLVIRSGLLDSRGLEQMLLVRCEAYEAASDHASALRDCDRALAIAPKDFHAYDARAAIYEAQSKFTQAVADYDRALQLAPSDRVAYDDRGAALEALGKHAEAVADFTHALALDPSLARDPQAGEERAGSSPR